MNLNVNELELSQFYFSTWYTTLLVWQLKSRINTVCTYCFLAFQTFEADCRFKERLFSDLLSFSKAVEFCQPKMEKNYKSLLSTQRILLELPQRKGDIYSGVKWVAAHRWILRCRILRGRGVWTGGGHVNTSTNTWKLFNFDIFGMFKVDGYKHQLLFIGE